VRVVDGVLKRGERIVRTMATKTKSTRPSTWVFTPKSTPRDELRAGEVGFIIAGIKQYVTEPRLNSYVLLPKTPKPLYYFE